MEIYLLMDISLMNIYFAHYRMYKDYQSCRRTIPNNFKSKERIYQMPLVNQGKLFVFLFIGTTSIVSYIRTPIWRRDRFMFENVLYRCALKVEPFWIPGSFLKLEHLKTEFNEDIGNYAIVKVTSHSYRIMVNLSIGGYFEVMWHP